LHPRWQKKYELPEPLVVFEIDAEPVLQLPRNSIAVSRFPGAPRPAVTVDEAPRCKSFDGTWAKPAI
jgi:phenylalanyl-tRNA synthetase beta subunit